MKEYRNAQWARDFKKKIMKAKKTREIKFETNTMEFLFFKFPNSWSLFHSFDF